MKYCFGIDVGGTTVKIGLFELDGTIVDKWEIVTHTENEGITILPDIAESLQKKMDELRICREDVKGIGIGIPAPVTEDGIVKNTVNLGWGYKEVTRELQELTGFPAKAGNDANMAALGEMWLGGGKGQKNMVMVTLGTGVGGGMICGGKIIFGQNGAAAEIGHICVNYEETETCGCGNTGCLEQYASATGIVRLARRRLAKNEDASMLREQELSAKAVFDALKAGDKVAEDIVEEFGWYLGNAAANIAAVADPSVFVIGGGVSKAGEILLGYIEKNYQKKAFFAHKDVKFVLAELGNDAGICGAAKLILDEK